MNKKPNFKHILLTGVPGIGKTTIVNKVCNILKDKNVPVVGFYTKELRNAYKSRIGFDVITLNGQVGKLARLIDLVSINERTNYRVGNYVVFVNEFEALALPLLHVQESNAVFILDEIGKMEMYSQPFIKTVTELFNIPDIKILATIPVQKNKPLPLVEKLRNDTSNHIITVNRENRDNVTEQILDLLDLE